MTARITATALLFLCACNEPSTPTPAGTSLLKTTFANAQGGPPEAMAAIAPSRHVSKVKIAEGAAELEVRLDVVDGPGGKYIHGVELVLTESGGGTVTAAVPSGMSPINRGTPEQVLASLTLMVEWRLTKRTSSSLRQTPIEISGDGTATAR